MPPGVMTESQAITQYYVDFDNGDDGHSGTAADRPWKTFARARQMIPSRLVHNTALILKGVSSEAITLDKEIAANVYFIVTGDRTLFTSLSGPYDITGGGTGSIVSAGLALTEDQYAGALIRILTGACAGQIRMLKQHTADTLVPGRLFGASPVGGTFDIVQPAAWLKGQVFVSCGGAGYMYLQNLTLGESSNNTLSINNCSASVVLSSLVSKSNNAISAVQAQASRNFGVFNSQLDPLTFAGVSLTTHAAGVGMLTRNPLRIIGGSGLSGIQGSFLGNVDIFESYALASMLSFGSRVRGKFEASRIGAPSSVVTAISNSSSYTPVSIDHSASVGLRIVGADITIDKSTGDIDISNNASHGIECVRSSLTLKSAISGSGNGGAGCYAHGNSFVEPKAGAAPTLTGTVGDVAVDNPAAQQSTWAAIEEGTPVASTNEFTVVRKA